jgi:glycosyltransferase involved in cell wall biosynthesis
MPLFSVIVPTFNRAAMLVGALESVRSQTFTDYELIVVDDGSTDDTQTVLARFAANEPAKRVRILRQDNAGAGAARNLAIAQARGEYCTFLDSDDLYFPWTLAIVAEAIATNDHPSVVIGREAGFVTMDDYNAITHPPLTLRSWPDLYAHTVQSHLGPCGIFVARTILLREAGGFITDRIVGEDTDLMFSLGTAPKMVKIDAPAMFAYRLHEGSFTKNYQKWYLGGCHFIERYRRGGFPGGAARAADIRKVVADSVGGMAFFALYQGGRRQCLELYLRTMGLHLRAGNYDYVLRTPVLMLLSVLRLWPRNQALSQNPMAKRREEQNGMKRDSSANVIPR